jgi:hypothetical protein
MTRTVAVLSMLVCVGQAQAQDTETHVLRHAVSNRETIVYTRTIRVDEHRHRFHVQDRYDDGRLQMDAF